MGGAQKGTRDDQLMKSLVSYLDCGSYHTRSAQNVGDFFVERYSDISQKIIPFFDKYPIRGVKALVYSNFKIVYPLLPLSKGVQGGS